MVAINNEYFEEFEIEHDLRTYYANGYVKLILTTCIGANYEGYDFEILHQTEVNSITITDLWYYDKETGHAVEILNQCEYKEIEEMAEEMIRYAYR